MISTYWGSATDVGLTRAHNEDALLADPPVFLVADGMGGHSAGEVASSLAVASFAGLAGAGPIGQNQVSEALLCANQTILDSASSDPDMAGMGTTIAGLAEVTTGGTQHWMVFNVGDSRVYRLLGGRLEQLTVDHSEAEEMVLAGRITRDEARSYHRRNVVTRSLGTDPPPTLDSWIFPPTEGECFMICSDGLTSEVPDEQIRECLLATPDPQGAAEELVRLALEAGGNDNVTVIVVGVSVSELKSVVDEDTAPRPS